MDYHYQLKLLHIYPQIEYFRQLIFSIFFNSSLLLVLIVGIQNSAEKSKIFLFKRETINMPISFIVGASFISGSLIGGLLSLNSNEERN